MGIYNKTTQERLLREAQSTLTKANNFCRATEANKMQSKALQSDNRTVALVDAVRKGVNEKICKFCEYRHSRYKKCPAYGKTCAKCQGRNNFAGVCLNSQAVTKNSTTNTNKKVHEIELVKIILRRMTVQEQKLVCCKRVRIRKAYD